MITKFQHHEFTWIDIENPSSEDINFIIKEFNVHPTWAHELLIPSERTKTDSSSNTFYTILHYPDHPANNQNSGDLEIDYYCR